MSKRRSASFRESDRSEAIRNNVLLSMFAAIIVVLTFTPIGFVNLGFIKATIIHVPVIIGSILLGPKRGTILGVLFGACSLVVNTVTPSLLSFAFSPLIPVPMLGRGSLLSLVVCFIPRILVGLLPYYVCRLLRFFMKDWEKSRPASLLFTGLVGSLTNTLFVMGFIYLFFREPYAQAKNISVEAVLGAILVVVGVNGVLEAIVAAALTAAVCLPLQKVMKTEKLQGRQSQQNIQDIGSEKRTSKGIPARSRTAERSAERDITSSEPDNLPEGELSADTQAALLAYKERADNMKGKSVD